MGKILVVGSLNIDMMVRVDHIPEEGETILCDHMEIIPGGKGANQAYALGCLKGKVCMLGAVGDDTNAEIQIRNLKKAGVDVSRIIRKQNVPTGTAVVAVSREGKNSIIVIGGANELLSPEDLDQNIDLFEEADILILQLEIPVETVCHAAKIAKSLGKMVILDPAPVPETLPEELFRYVDIIKPNETELCMLTNLQDTDEKKTKSVKQLQDRGVKNIVVTMGDKGAVLWEDGKEALKIDSVKVDVVDTTAAGDSFTAAMALMLHKKHSLAEAVQFANKVSSIVVTRKGAQTSIPTLEEVMA